MKTLTQPMIDEIRRLAEPDGNVQTQVLIDAAREPSNPLHGQFKWDIQEAAEAYWHDTARRLIRMVHIDVVVSPERTVTAVQYISGDPVTPREFCDIRSAEMAPTMRAELSRIFGNIDRTLRIAEARSVDDVAAKLRPMLVTVKRLMDKCEQLTRREEVA